MIVSRRLFSPLLVLAATLVTGCANHLKVDTHTETEMERQKVSQAIDIETNAGSLITVPLIAVQVQDSQAFKVKTYEAKTEYDVVTPYQGLRELYEVPLGLVLLPVAVVVNVLDFATLGLLPNKLTDVPLDWSFAGMNPFMNIESESRTERELVKSDKKLVDEKEEFLKKPFAGKTLQVSASEARIDVILDEHGKAEVSMIRLSALTTNIEKVTLKADNGEKSIQRDIDVSRQLRNQLENASIITGRYADLAATEPTPEAVAALDLKAFSTDLVALSKLGFESESLRIEKKARSLMTEDQRAAFNNELDKALQL